MGKIVMGGFVTVDGVYQAPGGQDEDREDGFEHGGWAAPFLDQQAEEAMVGLTLRADALLLGRKTYDIFAAFWPDADQDDPAAAKLNAMPRYVASRTLRSVEWEGTTLLGEDVVGAVEQLRGKYDEVGVTGSGDLMQTLLAHDLVDELTLLVCPVVLGSGKKLFGRGTAAARLALVGSDATPSGVAIHTYRRAGRVEYGQVGG